MVECVLEDTLVANPKGGKPIPGICITCGDCDHAVESPGKAEDGAAVTKLLQELRRTCKQNEKNYYRIIPE